MSELAKRVVVMLVVLIGASCADSEVSPTYMGNTNWLISCDEDDDCSDDLSCECGVCTKTCETSADCGTLGAACDTGSDALVSACGSSLADSICLPECEEDDDCGRGQCVDAHCLPAPMSNADGGASGDGDGDGDLAPIGCGPNGAFVSAALMPDQECIYSTQNAQAPIGRYDYARGAYGEDGGCEQPYVVSLLTYSCLRGVDDTLQIRSAEVRLMTVDRQTIVFDQLEPVLPNPFGVVSNATIFRTSEDDLSAGIVTVETIPSAYADQFDNFDGEEILAEITLFGTTLGDQDVELRPFVYPIRLCDGCLTLCRGDLPLDATDADIYGEGVCTDNAGADGRFCVDAECAGN